MYQILYYIVMIHFFIAIGLVIGLRTPWIMVMVILYTVCLLEYELEISKFVKEFPLSAQIRTAKYNTAVL